MRLITSIEFIFCAVVNGEFRIIQPFEIHSGFVRTSSLVKELVIIEESFGRIGSEAMTRVTMISMGKHSCVADATSNKRNFSTKDASTKRHVEDAHPARRKTRRKVGVASRYVLRRESLHRCARRI